MAGGQQITSGQGTLGPPRHGIAATAAAGTVGLAVTLALVGSAITSGQGFATANNSGTVALVGSSSTVQQQTIAPSWGQALTGSEGTAGQGTASPVINPSTSGGQAITPAAGSVAAAGGGPVTVNISGSEAVFAAGTVDSGSTLVSGSAVTGAQGSHGVGWDVPLTGHQATGSTGTISAGQEADDTYITSGQGSAGPSLAAALSGIESTGGQGTLQITSDASLPLVGEQSASAAGSAGLEKAFPISGQEASGAQYSVGAPGGAALGGAEITLVAGDVFLTGDRTFAISGQAITAQAGITFASSLAFPPGQALTISQQTMGPKAAALSGASSTVFTGPLLAEGGDRPVGVGAADYAGNSGKRKKKGRFLREIAGKVVEFPTAEAAMSAVDPSIVKLEEVAEPVVEAAVETPQVEDEEALLEMLVMTL